MNKGLRPIRVMTRKRILMNEFEQKSHERLSQNRARQAFELIKLFIYIFEMTDDFTIDKTLIHRLVSFKAAYLIRFAHKPNKRSLFLLLKSPFIRH